MPISNTLVDGSAEADLVRAVKRAITRMHDELSEPLTVEEMARSAMFSKFHFCRIFQQVTGVSPGRFLSAIRLQEAKVLLVSSTLSVTTISHRVGYASVGTFSYRFKESVGVSPSLYRQLGGLAPEVPARPRPGRSGVSGTVRGQVVVPDNFRPVFVGLFRRRIPQGQPSACMGLPGSGPFRLTNVPAGSWHLLVHAVAEHRLGSVPPLVTGSDEEALVAARGPITVTDGRTEVDCGVVRPHPARMIDPPVLVSLLDVRTAGQERLRHTVAEAMAR